MSISTQPTAASLHVKFGYCFQSPPGSDYPPIVTEHRLTAGTPVTIEGEGGPIAALPFRQEHGDIASLGFRFGKLAYSCDLSGLPPESVAALAGLDVWIVDALRYRPHPSHFSLDDALGWIERLKPRRAILTNLHADLDYEVLARQTAGACGAGVRRDDVCRLRKAHKYWVYGDMFHNMSYANRRIGESDIYV